MLKGKNIVLGVSGGIAVYKACDLASRLMKQHANIDVVMTESAARFVSPLTFQSLTLNQVTTDMFDAPKHWEIEHISLAQKADIYVIAPATANIIGKVASGIADDMLSTTIMATEAPVIFAPAMNTKMYENPIVQKNIAYLKSLGYLFIEPEEGRLACGDVGKGKLAAPEAIEAEIIRLLTATKDFGGKTIIVTAGATREEIDPVRFISNHSTGKMGFAIADRAAKRGARVILITGQTYLETPKGVERIDIGSADDMLEKIMTYFDQADIIIKSAAVSDYAPVEYSQQKMKKSEDEMILKLKKNPDIAYELGKIKGDKKLVGFAMETQDLIENATQKVKKKNFDFIVANDLFTEGAGFGTDTNVVKIIDKDGGVESLPIMTKGQLADIILDKCKK